MKIAAIDIGSNTILMQIIEYDNQTESINIIAEERGIARLSENINQTNIISENAIMRAEKILLQFYNVCKKLNVETIIAVGTSALREAKNSKEVCKRLENSFDNKICINVISAEREAILSFKGAIGNTKNLLQKYIVIDIGGGSTEIIVGDKKNIIYNISIPIGVVKLTEQFNITQPLNQSNILTISSYIKEKFSAINIPQTILDNAVLIAVSGTPTALAGINLGINEYDNDKINNYEFSITDLEKMLEIVYNSNLEEIINKYYIEPARADVLSAGALILHELLKKINRNSFIVSTNGLRHGICLDNI